MAGLPGPRPARASAPGLICVMIDSTADAPLLRRAPRVRKKIGRARKLEAAFSAQKSAPPGGREATTSRAVPAVPSVPGWEAQRAGSFDRWEGGLEGIPRAGLKGH